MRCKIPTGEEPSFDSVDDVDCQLLCSLRNNCFGYSQEKTRTACLLWTQPGLTGHGNGADDWNCFTKQEVNSVRDCEPPNIKVVPGLLQIPSKDAQVDGRIIELAPEAKSSPLLYTTTYTIDILD